MQIQLKLLTRILRARLSQVVCEETNILCQSDLDSSSSFVNHHGRCVGFFKLRSDDTLCFIFLRRARSSINFKRAFIFYLNSRYEVPQPEEVEFLRRGIGKPVDVTVVNATTSTSIFLHPSVLLCLAQYMIQRSLPEDSPPIISVPCGEGVTMVDRGRFRQTECFVDGSPTDTVKIWRSLFTLGLNPMIIEIYRMQPIPNDCHVIRLHYQRHIVYLINYKVIQAVILLIPHQGIFTNKRQADEFIATIKSSYHSETLAIKVYRYSGRRDCCNSAEILKACILLKSFPSVSIYQFDLDACVPDVHFDLFLAEHGGRGTSERTVDAVGARARFSQAVESSQASGSPRSQLEVLVSDPSIYDNPRSQLDNATISLLSDHESHAGSINFSGPHGHPELLSTSGTVIESFPDLSLYQEILSDEFARMQFRRDVKFNLLNFKYPPCNVVWPRDDPTFSSRRWTSS